MELIERVKQRLKLARENVAESLPRRYDYKEAEIRDLLEDVLTELDRAKPPA